MKLFRLNLKPKSRVGGTWGSTHNCGRQMPQLPVLLLLSLFRKRNLCFQFCKIPGVQGSFRCYLIQFS